MKNRNIIAADYSSKVIREEEEEMFAIRVGVSDVTERGYHLRSHIDPLALTRRVNISSSRDSVNSHVLYAFREAPKVDVFLQKEGTTITMNGNISGEIGAICSKCADEISLKISIPVNYLYKKLSQRINREDQLPDLEISFYDGLQIDIGETVCDLFILAIPLVPVCSNNCMGICQNCGVNLNREICLCNTNIQKQSPFSLLLNQNIAK